MKHLPWLSTLALLQLNVSFAAAQTEPVPSNAPLATPSESPAVPNEPPPAPSEVSQAPATPPQPLPSNPPPAAQPVSTRPIALETQAKQATHSSSVWVLRAATPLTARAEFVKSGTCDPSFRSFSVAARELCDPLIETTDNRRVTANDDSPFILNVELLALVGSLRRVGGGLSWNPLLTVGKGANWLHTLGDEISASAIFEQVFAGTDSTAGLVRASLGPTVLLPGGDLLNARHAAEKACTTEARKCDISDGPFLGFNLGLGFGTLHKIGPETRLRFDLGLQYLKVPVRMDKSSVDDSFVNSKAEINETLSSGRLMFGVGLER